MRHLCKSASVVNVSNMRYKAQSTQPAVSTSRKVNIVLGRLQLLSTPRIDAGETAEMDLPMVVHELRLRIDNDIACDEDARLLGGGQVVGAVRGKQRKQGPWSSMRHVALRLVVLYSVRRVKMVKLYVLMHERHNSVLRPDSLWPGCRSLPTLSTFSTPIPMRK